MENVCCYKCNKPSTKTFLFSCKHLICHLCIAKVIFKKNFKKLQSQDEIKLTCKCQLGSFSISINLLHSILTQLSALLEKIDVPSAKSSLNKNIDWKFLCFCCPGGDKDVVLDNDDNTCCNDMCKTHSTQKTELYCKDCKMEICQNCKIQSSHSKHSSVPIKDISESFKNSLKDIHCKSFSKYTKLLDKIHSDFQRKFNECFEGAIKQIDEVIHSLERLKEEFSKEMKTVLSKEDLVLKILKLLYSIFYSDMKKTSNGMDVKSLKFLNEIIWEPPEIILNYNHDFNEELTRIKSQIEDIKISQNCADVEYQFHAIQRNYTCDFTLTGHSACILSILQLEDGRIASGSDDKTIRIWSENENDHAFLCTQVLHGHLEGVRTLLQLDDGRVVSGSYDNSIKIWNDNMENFICTQTLAGHANSIAAVIQLKDRRLASASEDKTIRIWDTRNAFKCVATITGHKGQICSLIQLSDGRLASCSFDRSIRIWDVNKNFTCTNVLKEHKFNVYSLLQLNDGRLASGSGDKTMKIWDINHNFICTHTLYEYLSIRHNSLVQLKNSRIAFGSEDSAIRIWDMKKNFSCIQVIEGHSREVFCLIELRDGRIASGSLDKTIKIWRE